MFIPTVAPIGTREKADAFASRFVLGVPFHHPQDNQDCGARIRDRRPKKPCRAPATAFEILHARRVAHFERV